MKTSLRLALCVLVISFALSPALAQQPGKPVIVLVDDEPDVKALELKLKKMLKEIEEAKNKQARPETPKNPPPIKDAEAELKARRNRLEMLMKEAELKAARDRLEMLMKELREKEVKYPQPKPSTNPPKPGTLIPANEQPGWRVAPGSGLPPGASDPHAVIRGLTKHPDPKVAALATQLLEQLAKPQHGSGPLQLEIEGFEIKPGGPLEFKVEGAKQGKALELKIVPEEPKLGRPFELKLEPGRPLELKLERIDLKPGGQLEFKAVPEVVESRPVRRVVPNMAPATSAPGGSSLRLSSDGKTAAVIAADGSVTVYDVATGKEMMRFPAKK